MTKRSTILITASLATLLAHFAPAPVARAHIYQWEYINPANPSQGKQPSTTLAPDGAGVNAAPGSVLSFRNLTMAYLIGADLTGAIAVDTNLTNADLSHANLTNATFRGYEYCTDSGCEWIPEPNLTNANLSQANLTNAYFYATLTGANLTGAEVRGAGLSITTAQLYSTASYQAHDLSGIQLGINNLAVVNLASQNLTNAVVGGNLTNANFNQANLTGATVRGTLTNANFSLANLTNANLSNATLTGASFSQANLTNAGFGSTTLTNADFTQANLTNANLRGATLTGANLTAAEVRGADLGYSGITMAQLHSTASYQDHDLSGIGLEAIDLTGVNLAGYNLTNARFRGALANANFSLANLTNARFSGVFVCDEGGCGGYPGANLTSANLSQANLTNAGFGGATLSGANLTGTDVRGAQFWRDDAYFPDSGISIAQLYSTASYQAQDLSGIGLGGNNLAGVNFTNQNLTNAYFYLATLSGANFTGATVREANFSRDDSLGTGITTAQLYSTASYLAHDLTGIGLKFTSLAGSNLAGQNLTGADISRSNLTNANLSQANLANADLTFTTLTGANLSQANLTNAIVYYTSLDGANLSGADSRGTAGFDPAMLSGANTSNLIQSDGHIAGLALTAGASLVVRDDDVGSVWGSDSPPIPIRVDQSLAMGPGGTLRLVFDADPWDSTISFAPGIPVARGGTLELSFALEVSLVSQIGRTIDLFDWTGVAPTGTFTVSSPYSWNLSKLYTTGEVTLTAVPNLPGDFNHNGTVDAADYVVWRKTDATPAGYNAWRANFGTSLGVGSGAALPSAEPLSAAVPEPASLVLCVSSLLAISTFALRKPWRDRRHSPRHARNIV